MGAQSLSKRAHHEPTRIGRYAVFEAIAAGGMATVHVGRLVGSHGFERVVAVKRLHPHLARDPEFVAALIEEARIASRIRHPNVVAVLDVVEEPGEGVCLVMDYVEGASLGALVRASLRAAGAPPAAGIVTALIAGALRGLHAAHEATANGTSLGIVHRDVSPQNVLVGKDGIARIVDFGIAKALGRMLATTQHGQIKGKLPYMAPEQLRPGGVVTRRTDVYGAGVVLWEALTATHLFGRNEVDLALPPRPAVRPPSAVEPSVPAALDAVVLRALSLEPAERYADADEMARALEAAIPVAPVHVVEQWVKENAGPELALHAERIALAESASLSPAGSPEAPPPEAAAKAKPRHRLRSILPMALAAALVGAVLFLSMRGVERATTTPSRAQEEDSATGPTSLISTGTGPAGSASAPPAGVPSLALPTPPASARTHPTVPRSSTTTRVCNPPYYVERGIKIFKPECLR